MRRSLTIDASQPPADAASFGRQIRAWDAELRGVAWSVVRSQQATDDVMQDAYERAFRALHTFEGGSSMKTWIFSIVYRTAIDYLRRETRRQHESIDLLAGSADDVRTSSFAPDPLAAIELESLLDSCTPEQRSILMLTAGYGFSYDETAEILDMSRGTVASKVSRLRTRLQRWEDQ